MVQALSASKRRLCANNPPALNTVGLWITQGKGDLSRTQMEGLKFKLCHPCHSDLHYIIATHVTCGNAFLKTGRHSAVTSYLVQQINHMLFSQDVQANVLIL